MEHIDRSISFSEHLCVCMYTHNMHTWTVVMLWFRTSLLCPLAYSSNAYTFHNSFWWSLVTPSHIPAMCCRNIWALHMNMCWCLACFLCQISSLYPSTLFCAPSGHPVWTTSMGSLPSGFWLVWPMRSPGRKWEGERRVRSGYSFPWLPPCRSTSGWPWPSSAGPCKSLHEILCF